MFKTIRRQFLVEVTGDRDPARHQVTSRDEVNQLPDHWVRKACHHAQPPEQSRQHQIVIAPTPLAADSRINTDCTVIVVSP